MFQNLPIDVIALILLKAHRAQPERHLPDFAATCKLFQVLSVETMETAFVIGGHPRLHLITCSKHLTTLRILTRSPWHDHSIAQAVRRLSRLEDLCIGFPGPLPNTLRALRACPRLRRIEAFHPGAWFFPELPHLRALASLRVLVRLGDVAFQPAAKQLSRCEALRGLEWVMERDPYGGFGPDYHDEYDDWDVGLYDEDAFPDPAPLLTLPQLTRLFVQFRNEDGGRQPWKWSTGDSLPLSKSIRDLTVSGRLLPPMDRLWRALRGSDVEAIWLTHVPPPDVLLSMRNLTHLTVDAPDSAVSDVVVVVDGLVGCLPQLRKLRKLYLEDWSDCGMKNGARHLDAVLRVLPECAAIKSVALTRPQLTRGGAESMCAAMERNHWGLIILALQPGLCEPGVVEAVKACAAQRGVQVSEVHQP